MKKLKDIPFFSEFDDNLFEELFSASIFQNCNKGKILFFEGDEPRYLYVLLEGKVRVYKAKNKGRQLYIHRFTPVSLIGELANFENVLHPVTAEFTSQGRVLKIDYKKLGSDFFKKPEIASKIIESLSGKIKILSDVIHKETILSSDAKVAKFIIESGELFGKIKNAQIASLLNITPETLSRVLGKFKKEGLIEIAEKNSIKILNSTKLQYIFLGH